MKIATFNVNGVNGRLALLLAWPLNGEAAERLETDRVDREVRTRPHASDHRSAWIDLHK